jgi:hypothetical protein
MQTLLTLAQQQGVLFSPNTQFLQAEKNNTGFHIALILNISIASIILLVITIKFQEKNNLLPQSNNTIQI